MTRVISIVVTYVMMCANNKDYIFINGKLWILHGVLIKL